MSIAAAPVQLHPMNKEDVYQYPVDLINDMAMRFVRGDPTLVESTVGFTTFGYARLMTVLQPRMDLDLGLAGYTAYRWKTFLNTYLEAPGFRDWLKRIPENDERSVVEYRIPQAAGRHKNGACLTSLAFYRLGTPTVMMVSRSTQIIPMGVLDLCLLSMLALHLRDTLGIKLPRIIWFTQQLQFRADFSTPYLTGTGLIQEVIDHPNPPPFMRRIKYSIGRVVDRYESGGRFKFERYNRLARKLAGMRQGVYEHYTPSDLHIDGEHILTLKSLE